MSRHLQLQVRTSVSCRWLPCLLAATGNEPVQVPRSGPLNQAEVIFPVSSLCPLHQVWLVAVLDNMDSAGQRKNVHVRAVRARLEQKCTRPTTCQTCGWPFFGGQLCDSRMYCTSCV